MDDQEYQANLRQVLAIGPKERERQVIAQSTADLIALGVPMETARDIVASLYNLGWQDGLLFWGRPGAEWPDGHPFVRIVDQS